EGTAWSHYGIRRGLLDCTVARAADVASESGVPPGLVEFDAVPNAHSQKRWISIGGPACQGSHFLGNVLRLGCRAQYGRRARLAPRPERAYPEGMSSGRRVLHQGFLPDPDR